MEQEALDAIMGAAEGGTISPALKLQLDKVAKRVGDIDTEIAALEEKSKTLSKERHNITSKVLPTVLNQCGLQSYATDNGLEVELDTVVSGSLPKDEAKRKLAIAKVKEYDGEGIIKMEVYAEFMKGESSQAEKCLAAIQKAGFNHAVMIEGIHPQTLAAFARERLKKGKEVDGEAIGLYIQQVAKVSPVEVKIKPSHSNPRPPKEPKAKKGDK